MAWLAAVCASLAVAQDPATQTMEQVRKLEQEFKELQAKAQRDFGELEKLPEGERNAAGDRIYSEFQKAAGPIAEHLVAIATEDFGAAGLAAVAASLRLNLSKAQRASIVEVLTDHHAAGEGIVALLPGLRYVGGKKVDALLEKVIAENPAKKAKGLASMTLAQRAKEDDREQLFERAIADFGDVDLGTETVAQAAGRQLFAIRNIKIGGTPPDIDGRDMDGAAFKLSDYRGKVVVLDFWGFW